MTPPVITAIPKEIVQLIPLFKGDKRQLNLYLRKCQYVIDRYGRNESEEQSLYVYNVLTSRLTEDAAALLSERDDVVTWSALKELLIQHFGDPRSEECINIELESLKIKSGESYLDFCNRIQSVRSLLMSKVNTTANGDLKRAKLIIYNNTALNVFLYNLPENMVRVVRLKKPSTLETALSVVLEEVNFLEQYNMRNRIHGSSQIIGSSSRPLITQPPGFKPMLPSNNAPPKFNFGIPQNAPIRMPHIQGQGQTQNYETFRPSTFGYKPQFGHQPQQQTGPQQFGYRPTQQFGYRSPQQFGYRPPQQFGYRPPQQFGYKPPQQFGYKPPQQFEDRSPQFGYRPQFGTPPTQPFQVGYRPPQVQAPQLQTSDVTMRTVVPKAQIPQQDFKVNELCDYNAYYDDYGYCDTNELNYFTDVKYDENGQTDETQAVDSPIPNDRQEIIELNFTKNNTDVEIDNMLEENSSKIRLDHTLTKDELKLKQHMKDVVKYIDKVTAEKKTARNDSSTITVSDSNRTATVSPIAISDTLSRHSLDNDEYPVRSESSKSQTIPSVTELTPFEVVFEHTDTSSPYGIQLEKRYFQKLVKDHAKQKKVLYEHMADKMVVIKEKNREKTGGERDIEFSVGKTIYAKDVNKRKNKDKPRYVKAKKKIKNVVGEQEWNVLPIQVGERKTQAPFKNIKRPPQVQPTASSGAIAGPSSTNP